MITDNFWKNFFSLKKRYYFLTIPNLLFLIYFFGIVPRDLTNNSIGLGIEIASLLYFVLGLLVYPWVRLSILRRPGSHYLISTLKLLGFAIIPGPKVNNTWEVTTVYRNRPADVRQYSETTGGWDIVSWPFKAILIVSLMILRAYVVEIFLTIIGPILFLFLNFKKLYNLAVRKGYLSSKAPVSAETKYSQIMYITSIVTTAAIITLVCSILTFGNLNFALEHSPNYINGTRTDYIDYIVKPYAKKYGVPKNIIDKSLTNHDTIDLVKRQYTLAITGKDGKKLADMFFTKVSHNLNNIITTNKNQHYLKAKENFLAHYKEDLYHSELQNKPTKDDIQQTRYQFRWVTQYRYDLFIIVATNFIIIFIALFGYKNANVSLSSISKNIHISALISYSSLLILELAIKIMFKFRILNINEYSNLILNWHLAIIIIFLTLSLGPTLSYKIKKTKLF